MANKREFPLAKTRNIGIMAHIDDDTPEEERQQIINFIENLKKARK